MLGHRTNSVSWGGAVGLVTVDDGVLIRVNQGRSAGGAAGVCTWGCSRYDECAVAYDCINMVIKDRSQDEYGRGTQHTILQTLWGAS